MDGAGLEREASPPETVEAVEAALVLEWGGEDVTGPACMACGPASISDAPSAVPP